MGRDRDVSKGNVRGAHRYRRGRVWWAYAPGRGRWSLGTTDEREAEQRFAEALAQPSRAPRTRSAEAPSIEQVVEAYVSAPHGWTRRTQRSASQRATAFAEWCTSRGLTLPAQLTSRALGLWRESRLAEVSAATVNRDEDVIRKCFRWASEQSPALCAPVDGLVRRRRLRESKRDQLELVPSPAECERIAQAFGDDEAGAWLGLAVRLAVATGLRREELTRLRAEDVSETWVRVYPEEGAHADAWSGKSHKERRIPAPPETIALAREWVRVRGARVLSDSTTKRLHTAAAKVELTVKGWHDFRRTFATECVRAGAPLHHVQRWLGHELLSTTQRYLGRYRSDSELRAPVVYSLYKTGVTASPFEPSSVPPANDNGRGKRPVK